MKRASQQCFRGRCRRLENAPIPISRTNSTSLHAPRIAARKESLLWIQSRVPELTWCPSRARCMRCNQRDCRMIHLFQNNGNRFLRLHGAGKKLKTTRRLCLTSFTTPPTAFKPTPPFSHPFSTAAQSSPAHRHKAPQTPSPNLWARYPAPLTRPPRD